MNTEQRQTLYNLLSTVHDKLGKCKLTIVNDNYDDSAITSRIQDLVSVTSDILEINLSFIKQNALLKGDMF